MQCQNCGKELIKRQTKFCSVLCKREFYKKIKYQTKYWRKRDTEGTKLKIEAIKRLGGKCSICGYNKNIAALTFHHLRDKKFTLNSRNFKCFSKEKVEEELKKCILLCHNCHSEIHHPELNDLI